MRALPESLYLLLLLLLSGCGLLPACLDPAVHRVELVLPPLPPVWAFLEGVRLELTWTGPGGEPRSALLPPGSRLAVELERGAFQAILARPLAGGIRLKPAGALYPADLGGPAFRPPIGPPETLVLGWEGAYAAAVAAELAASGLDPSAWDLGRLGREAASRLADPWIYPAREAARRLASGTFRADLLREPPRWTACLPGPGPWARESPLAQAPREDGSGSWILDLPAGLSLLAGNGASLLVAVSEEGAVSVLPGGD